MAKNSTEELKEEFTSYKCPFCEQGQGISSRATDTQKEAFAKFCERHGSNCEMSVNPRISR